MATLLVVPHLGQEATKLYQRERVHEDLGHAGEELGVSRDSVIRSALLHEDDARMQTQKCNILCSSQNWK